ncbi:MAG: deoxyhypusine synthase family protein [Syntrophales bacterium]|jgi:deoxyhypusine synthase|nr:deoxyhypusine synthase family protein [Syntrophales bacterium]MCK9528241.1 deoxyhypusine synthase family protein [Syntrophales bacterium]MDX9922372.1 deoxyhypusine synthase family protein [Syntrophales bacterium]
MKSFFASQEEKNRIQSDSVAGFIRHHFRHFNAATLVDAAEGYRTFIDDGGTMVISLAGAMSTAELGLSLAEMIRHDKVHAISSTGANLEEDIFNLVAHDYYLRVPHYRDLTPQDEYEILQRKMSRVTDTCIPEEEAFRRIEKAIIELWIEADRRGDRYFPHEFIYRLLKSGRIEEYYQIDPRDSWVVAACEKNLPIFVPGWEDSTLGNVYAAHCIRGTIKNVHTVRTGIEYMLYLSQWYQETSTDRAMGFFQIGGGIAGDFSICVVPMLRQDMRLNDTPLWTYFCQISDSTTSYGSYSGAIPNEKITWEKLDVTTPGYVIESDATIVAPLIFSYVLEESRT